MFKHLLLTISLLIGLISISFSQTKIPHRCAGDEKMEAIYAEHPILKKQIAQGIKDFAKSNKNKTQKTTLPPIITIPVHVVIVHPPGQSVGTGINFSLAHVESQIEVLTDDFRRWNDDAPNTPAVFSVSDSEIQFCLASTDPNGLPTDGITRHASNQNFNSNEFALKSATNWPRADYLNMYVGQNTGALGWAYLPSTTGLPNATLDGIVIESGTFGGPGYGTINNFDLGRTAVHEVGHYLGLPHIWGGGCGNDDGFADTPNQSGPNSGCPNHPNPSCGNGGDMFMNYMDYVYDDCYNAFSTDQGDYMRLILMTSRSSLMNSAATNCASATPALTTFISTQTDVDCFGDASGSFTITATGGVPPYTYSINSGSPQTSETFSNLSAGFYTIAVADSDGTTFLLNTVIEEPFPITLTIESTQDVDCFGGNNGVITVEAFGGTPPPGDLYLYSIDGESFSPLNSFVGLGAGNYQISVMDFNDCVETIFIDITEPEELNIALDNVTNVDCFGNETGEIFVSSEGGTPAYSYSMDLTNYQNSGNFNGLIAGTYTVFVVDFNNCADEVTFEVTAPDILLVTPISEIEVDCFGEATGSVSLVGLGGSPDYQYAIDDGIYQSSPDFEDLLAGNYSFSVLDNNGCESFTDATITEPEELTIEVLNTTDVDCVGDNSGVIDVLALGGTQTYTYILGSASNNNGQFTNLIGGIYTVEVTDGNGCSSALTTGIIENSTLELLIPASDNVSCFDGNDGFILAEGLGGDGNYQYALNNGSFNTNGSFQELAAGNYSVQVLDGNGCLETTSFEVQEPLEVNGTLNTLQNPDCFENENGMLQVVGNGGNGNFTYSLNGETNSTGQFNNLPAGNYLIQISDGNGCLGTTPATIEAPESLTGAIDNTSNVDCFGNENGALTFSANGGTGAYSYKLNNLTNTDGVFNNLPSGNYTAIVSDANGCTTEVPATISEPTGLTSTLDNTSNVDCFEGNNGNLTVSANGGMGIYQFNLNTETNADGYFENLMAGTYTINVVDENNCEYDVIAEIQDGQIIETSTLSQTNVACFGDENGLVELMATGGNGDFEYTLNGNTNSTGIFENLTADVYPVQITDALGCMNSYEFEITEPIELTAEVSNITNIDCNGMTSGATVIITNGGTGAIEFSLNGTTNNTGNFENLASGEYQAKAIDENSCETTIDLEIFEPNPISSETIAVQEVSCFNEIDGSFEVKATGGNGGFQYTLNGETNVTGIFQNVATGEYEVQIIDANNCESAISVTVETPEALTIEVANIENINCSTDPIGLIEVAAVGGNGSYQYTLNTETNSTGIFENMPAGEYLIEVIDANNCMNSIEAAVLQTDELGAGIGALSDIDCAGNSNGMVEIEALGGNGNYVFDLGTQSNQTGIFSNLDVGMYAVFVSDDADCNTTIEFEIIEPSQLAANSTQTVDIPCFGEEIGGVLATGEGGTLGYEYTLGFATNTTGIFENLAGGWHNIFITDANGCGVNTSIFVEEPEEVSATIDNQDVNCFGENNGAIQATAMGGTGAFTYILGNEMNTTGNFNNLGPNEYEILISDENGCEVIAQAAITEPALLEITETTVINVACFEDKSGFAQIIGMGGIEPYNFTLDGETNTDGKFEDLAAGEYTFELEDANGCLTTQIATITEPDELLMGAINIQNETGSNNGSFEVETSGGTAPYLYSINSIDFFTDPPFSNLGEGTYTAYVKDAKGCLTEIEVEIGLDVATSEPDAGLNYLEVFPNPFESDLWVEIELANTQDLEFVLFNIAGIQVYVIEKQLMTGKQIFRLNLDTNIPKGAYLLEVRGEGFGKWFRVLRQ